MRKEYSIEILQQIINKYPGLGVINNFELFTSGFENSNYGIETEKGRFVIKIFEGIGMTRDNILFELEVMDHSHKSGVKTPHILLTNARELHTTVEKKYAILMDFIPGENLDHKTISDDLAQQIGLEAGKMDKALQMFKDGSKTRQNYEWDLKTFQQLEQLANLLPNKFNKDIFYEIFKDFKKIKPTFDRSPAGLVHNDIGLHNIIAGTDRLMGILDFSDMAYSPYIQNIATSFAQLLFCYNWQPQQAKIFLEGYRKHRNVSLEEVDLLYDMTRTRYATIIIEFNRWNYEFGEDSQRTEAINDFYEFLSKFESLGRAGFTKLLK